MQNEEKDDWEVQKHELHDYIAELERGQSNILWEDAHKNAAGVDRLLWKGRDDAPMVQRLGIAIFALMFLLVGIAILLLGIEQQMALEWILSALLILLAAKLFRNALRGLGRKRL